MGSRYVLMAMLLLAACKAQLDDGPTDASISPDSSNNLVRDSASDGPTILGAWGTAVPVPGASSTADEDDCTLSSTKNELIFKRNDAGDNNLYVMTRASTMSPWSGPAPLSALNTTGNEESPRLTSDDLTIYFGRAGDIYSSTRLAIGQPWSTPATPVSALNTANNEKWAAVCSSGYAIVSRANGTNLQDLYEGTITGGANTLLTQMNTATNEQGTFLSADCLTLYFQSNRTNDQFDIYYATRMTATGAWSNPSPATDFNTNTVNEEDAWLSTDQRMFAFARTVAGNGKDVFISTR